MTKLLLGLFVAILLLNTAPQTLTSQTRKVFTVRQYALELVMNEWSIAEWESFNAIIKKESSWNHTAQNPTSTAYGLGQFLDSTWKTVGYEKTDNPYIQLEATVAYIKGRYDTPSKALAFHHKNNWY